MKKTLKTIAAIMLLTAGTITFTSCNDEDEMSNNINRWNSENTVTQKDLSASRGLFYVDIIVRDANGNIRHIYAIVAGTYNYLTGEIILSPQPIFVRDSEGNLTGDIIYCIGPDDRDNPNEGKFTFVDRNDNVLAAYTEEEMAGFFVANEEDDSRE